MTEIDEVKAELPRWVIGWDAEAGLLLARQPGSSGVIIEGSCAKDIIARARRVIRLQALADALLGPVDALVLLSDDHWPETVGKARTVEWPLSPAGGSGRVRPRAKALRGLAGASGGRTEVRSPASLDPQASGSAVEKILTAKAKGYTGLPCDNCGGMNTLRSGTCLKCADCNHAGGCG